MKSESPECRTHGPASKRPWYLTGLFLVALLTVVLLSASFLFPMFTAFRTSFLDYLGMIGWPVAAGFILGGLIETYVPKEYVSKYLARTSRKTILYSVGLGFIMSACSHGILALSMELHKKGAAGPAVVSFLLASPWANLPITFLLIGFFGWQGLLIIFAALFVAMTTGWVFQFLDHKGWIERNRHSVSVAPDFSILQDVARRFQNYSFGFRQLGRDVRGIFRGIGNLAQMVLGWVLLGVVLASLASAFVPSEIFHRFFGPSLAGLFATLALAAIFEVCSEGTSPLAFELYKQTGALGNAYAFLMGGVVTDYTEIGLIWTSLGRRTALAMLAVTIPQVLLLGFVFNLLF